MHIAIVVPAYNESKHISQVIKDILSHSSKIKYNKLSLIVVDDGSKDDTFVIAEECKKSHRLYPNQRLHVARHRINLGKGAAAKTGCDAACKLGADLIVLMDGDGQHQAKDIVDLIKPLLTRDKGLVVGVREINHQMPFMMRFGNTVLTYFARVMFNIKVRDIQSGFRAFTRKTYPEIRWATSQYAMENEMLILASERQIPTFETSIPTVYHDNYKGTTALDGLRVFRIMLGWWIFKFQNYRKLENFQLDNLRITNS